MTQNTPLHQTTEKNLDRNGGSGAGVRDGRVRLELWCDDRSGLDDPIYVWMSPGQAMGLVEQLSRAARMALKEQL